MPTEPHAAATPGELGDRWEEPPTRAPSFRVLLVEDEDGARAVLRQSIEGLGYQCDVARDGVDALERRPDQLHRRDLATANQCSRLRRG